MVNDKETAIKDITIDQPNFNAPDERAAKLARTPQPVKDEAAKLGVENCCIREYWAVVERDGTLVRGRNVLRTSRLGHR